MAKVPLKTHPPLRSHLSSALLCVALTIACNVATHPQTIKTETQARTIAARFAPIFYQGIGEDPRADFITNFDFDGDWRGDNNWANLANEKFPLKAYIYYAVSETRTHLFIHYAVFHPRDYKGGSTRGRILSEVIREGVKRSGNLDPTGLAAEATLAHENDMEGCLIVVAKRGAGLAAARVVFVETLAHNHFLRYRPDATDGSASVTFEDERPRLYIEPKGHGIQAYVESDKDSSRRVLRYRYDGKADAPTIKAEMANYDLLPIEKTLWPRAQRGVNETYGTKHDYGRFKIMRALSNGKNASQTVRVGVLGASYLGKVGGQNMARPPWGWFDQNEREVAAGAWFFDPANTVKKHFKLGDEMSVAYTRQTFLRLKAR